MAKRKQNKSVDAVINKLIALGLALCGKLGTMMMAMQYDTWGLGALMRLSGTLVTLVFWWPYYLLGLLTNSLFGFNLSSNWVTQSWIFIIIVSFFGWYVVLSLLPKKGKNKLSGTIRQIG